MLLHVIYICQGKAHFGFVFKLILYGTPEFHVENFKAGTWKEPRY